MFKVYRYAHDLCHTIMQLVKVSLHLALYVFQALDYMLGQYDGYIICRIKLGLSWLFTMSWRVENNLWIGLQLLQFQVLMMGTLSETWGRVCPEKGPKWRSPPSSLLEKLILKDKHMNTFQMYHCTRCNFRIVDGLLLIKN